MYSTEQYRTQQVDASHGGTTSGNQANQSSSHMSVAAKAGEMQIFSSDILSQVNGLQRRQTTKTIIRPGGKYSSQTNDNKNRFNHIQEQMNNVEEKMLKIDTTKANERAPTQPAHSEVNQLLQTLQSQVNDRAQPMPSHNQPMGAQLSRDSLPQSQKHQTLPAQQRLHPSQTFSEYMQTNQTLHPKSRMPSNLPAVSHLNQVQLINQKQNSGDGSTGLSSNVPISNSSSAIGQPISSSYSGQPEDGHTRQISPVLHSHPSQKHLKIEVQSSQQKRTGAQLVTNQVDQSFTPTMIRRSIGSRSAAKQGERLSFLDKTAPKNTMEMASLEVKNPVPALPITATIKKIQAQKRDQQQQLLQSRYTNGTEPNMLPKMAGISLERRNANQSKQNQNLPPTGNLSLIQQGHLRRRHGDGSYGGPAGNRMSFGVSGESLQIKLTGTSLMNQNRQRETHSQQMMKETENSINLGVSGQGQPMSLVYHPKLRKRQPEFSQPYNSVGGTTAAHGQQQFAQQMAEMQMNSPRNGNQIFQENTQHNRIYSYHYIYNYLFVQVTEAQFEREYAHRIRVNPYTYNETEETSTDDRTLNSQNEENIQPGHQEQQADLMSSPGSRQRGPPLKLNQNQVFFSPQVTRDSQGKIVSQSLPSEEQPTCRFRNNNSTENTNENDFQEQDPNSLHSSDFHSRRQVIKMKKSKIGNALDGSLQSTQYEGLKVLTKDTILRAQKTLAEIKGQDPAIKLVPSLKLENEDPKQSALPELSEDEEQVNKFMVELGHWLQDQNMRFKVTVKKKYINDILMQSKGAQNLAQNVVMVITNRTTQISMNSPHKRVKRVKRNLSVDVSSGDEDLDNNNPRGNINRSSMRVGGQATPQVTASKAKAQAIGRRGYESENENKSLNSTTTSSTFPNLKAAAGGYATKQQNTPRQPRKMSTRSLSQIPNSVRIQRKATDDINGAGATAGATERADELLSHLNDRYPPAKIKIVHTNKYNDHMDHPINKMMSDYNEFCRLVFRSRVTEAQAIQNIPYAIKLGKRLGMQLNKNQLMPATLKVRENSNAIKEKLIFHICRVLQRESEFEPTTDDTCKIFNKQVSEHTINLQENQKQLLTHYDVAKQQAFHYRCYVGKGNNQMLVRSLFKNRFWWLFQEKEEPEKINFFWTQLRKYAIMNSLTCKLVNPKCKNQQRYMKTESQTSPSQGLGMSIASNNALLTPITASSKIKKRKLSSAQSKSPDALTGKVNPAGTEPAASQNSSQVGNVAMTLVGAANRPSESNDVEETKVDLHGVTAAPPQMPVVQPAAPKEETKKEPGRPKVYDTYPVKMANKIEDNYHLCNKKALFVNMKNYYEAIGEDPFDALPVTFHVKEGLDDPNYLAFKQYYQDHADQNNIWITKPGECTNRGVGIQVAKEWDELQQIIVEQTRASKKTCIVQKYIHNPLLIHRRKFDIRTFCMATSHNGNYKAYYYTEGYLRTSCREFSLANLSNRMVHLTNDAVQKKSEDYGKYEPGNKMSYSEFQTYIDKHCGSLNVCYERDILPQIKKLTTDCFRATWGKMDPYKRFNTFECFGLDFMIDEQFKVFLIEVNTNPCLELSSPLLARLIPSMLENSLRLAVDPLFPPPEHFSQRKHVVNELCPENKFELIFDERIDGPELLEIWRNKDNVIIEIDEEELSDADIDRPQGAEKDMD